MDVDIVVMWVDGNDPEWIKEKAKYSPTMENDSNCVKRFRDWGLMKYWFRGIEKYMPWVRKIFLVTWGHTPSFLNINHTKLRVVTHDEFIPKECLPTFNSCSIEVNLHRIPDLSENFILFNDDMFVIKQLDKSYFFSNGKPCTYYSEFPIALSGDFEVWQWHVVNNLRIINKYVRKKNQLLENLFTYLNPKFGIKDNLRSLLLLVAYSSFFTGFKNIHSVNAYCKDTYRELWEKEYEVLYNTSNNRFRDRDDVNQWLFLWWQIANGNFCPQKTSSFVSDISQNNISEICNVIINQKYNIVVLNDASDEHDFSKLQNKLHNAFEKALSEKSSFEK